MSAGAAFRERYGPWAVVVGGSEGLGADFAARSAARGLNVVLVARRAAPLEVAAAGLRARFPVEVLAVTADAASDAGLALLFEATRALDVGLLVHSAAVSMIGEFTEREAAEHTALVALNCRATALLSHHFGRRLRTRGRGGLIFVSSMASLQGTALVAHYAASKAYQRVLAEGLWVELRPHGVDVLACLAGVVDTPTYRAGHPVALSFPPMLEGGFVADRTLAALGGGPVVVPGVLQRGAAFFASRLLPAGLRSRIASSSTRRMYPRP